jgi:hypothetical protein
MKKKLYVPFFFFTHQFNFFFIVSMIYESKTCPTVVRARSPALGTTALIVLLKRHRAVSDPRATGDISDHCDVSETDVCKFRRIRSRVNAYTLFADETRFITSSGCISTLLHYYGKLAKAQQYKTLHGVRLRTHRVALTVRTQFEWPCLRKCSDSPVRNIKP